MTDRLLLLVAALVVLPAPLTLAQDEELHARLEAAAAAYVPKFQSAELLPFDPSEWETNEGFAPIGDPVNARKGGRIKQAWTDFPPTLRTDGPQSNMVQTSNLHNLIYEPLVDIHPTTLAFVPTLATHWKISEDKMTFHYRIDPDARWADGSPVTADDVVASYEHRIDESRQDPSNVLVFTKYESVVALDRLTVEVKCKERNWRNPIYFGGMAIFPAKYVRCSGDDYLQAYNWKFMMGSGPYEMKAKDFVQREAITLTRREDYWGYGKPFAAGLYNFDKIEHTTVNTPLIQWEMFKTGELDAFFVGRAQRWAEEVPQVEAIQKNWAAAAKVQTREPQGFSGFVFNMRKAPFDDVRVRRAWAHLFNRKKLIENLFYNQYEYIDSYYPGSVYGNPDNPKVRYDPRLADRLLQEAGYSERNESGILVKDGKPFEIVLEVGSDGMVRILTPLLEDYKAAGIDLKLERIDATALYKKIQDREFTVHYQWWGAIIFPNPETSWHSRLADQDANNNIPGFQNTRVDRYCDRYDDTWDPVERINIIRRIDKTVFREYPYALGWYGPFARIAYWKRLAHPATYFSCTSRPDADILRMWWFDGEADERVKAAQAKDAALEGPGKPVAADPWKDVEIVSVGFDKDKDKEKDEKEDDD